MTAGTQNMQDLATMNPDEATVMIGDIPCTVRRVRMRELMKLAKVITNGAGDAFGRLDFTAGNADQTLAAALMMAIPNAEDEFMELVQALVQPTQKLSDAQRVAFNIEIANPDAMIGFDVVEILARQEKDTFATLLGKAKTLLKTLQALYLTGKKDS